MSYTIVVARYNEDIRWLGSDISNCIIYNKGEKLPYTNINEIMLPNVGRESETYLNYIITHYDNLPDVVIFTQARIRDHRDDGTIHYLYQLKREAEICGKSNPFLSQSKYKTDLDLGWNGCWGPEWNVGEDGSFDLSHNYLLNRPMSFIKWFTSHIQETYPDPIHIYCNGLFAVRKDFILRRPLAYYTFLINSVNHHIDPIEGHFFERAWYYIFT